MQTVTHVKEHVSLGHTRSFMAVREPRALANACMGVRLTRPFLVSMTRWSSAEDSLKDIMAATRAPLLTFNTCRDKIHRSTAKPVDAQQGFRHAQPAPQSQQDLELTSI